jgi:hypothetical protein
VCWTLLAVCGAAVSGTAVPPCGVGGSDLQDAFITVGVVIGDGLLELQASGGAPQREIYSMGCLLTTPPGSYLRIKSTCMLDRPLHSVA